MFWSFIGISLPTEEDYFATSTKKTSRYQAIIVPINIFELNLSKTNEDTFKCIYCHILQSEKYVVYIEILLPMNVFGRRKFLNSNQNKIPCFSDAFLLVNSVNKFTDENAKDLESTFDVYWLIGDNRYQMSFEDREQIFHPELFNSDNRELIKYEYQNVRMSYIWWEESLFSFWSTNILIFDINKYCLLSHLTKWWSGLWKYCDIYIENIGIYKTYLNLILISSLID